MQAGTVDRYSRFVAFFKILLPLLALGLLSIMFLISRGVNDTVNLPFNESDIAERLKREGVTKPRFVGVAPNGERITLVAATAQPAGFAEPAQAQGLTAIIEIPNQKATRYEVRAAKGVIDKAKDIAQLSGDVHIKTSTGYSLTTDILEISLNTLALHSMGPIQGESPLGELNSGLMTLTSNSETDTTKLRFENGVKLVYYPQREQEH